jgi:holliday junction DNA helicase RuvA
MLSYLKGKIIYKNSGFVIVDVRDTGYKVFVGSEFYADLKMDGVYELYLHHHVREDAQQLYGFKGMAELEMFELLLSISGVGPKSALGVIAVAAPEELREAIASGDASLLTKVSGIGKKTAERIVLELREKVGRLGASAGRLEGGSYASSSSDEIDALMALGYSLPQARDAMKAVDPEIKDSGERIRQALKKIGK